VSGQQLVQMPGGKIQVVYTAPVQSLANVTGTNTVTTGSPLLSAATTSLTMPALTRTMTTMAGKVTPTTQLMSGKVLQSASPVTQGQVKVMQCSTSHSY
jgi:hypothetical protein